MGRGGLQCTRKRAETQRAPEATYGGGTPRAGVAEGREGGGLHFTGDQACIVNHNAQSSGKGAHGGPAREGDATADEGRAGGGGGPGREGLDPVGGATAGRDGAGGGADLDGKLGADGIGGGILATGGRAGEFGATGGATGGLGGAFVSGRGGGATDGRSGALGGARGGATAGRVGAAIGARAGTLAPAPAQGSKPRGASIHCKQEPTSRHAGAPRLSERRHPSREESGQHRRTVVGGVRLGSRSGARCRPCWWRRPRPSSTCSRRSIERSAWVQQRDHR